ncbi:MAG: helix-turn-helix domain-containing protein [Nitrospirales bacterium]
MLLANGEAIYPDAVTFQDQKGSLVGKLLTVPEAADRLKLQPCTIRKWIFERRLAHVRIGRRAVRIREADVENLIREGYAPAK